MSILDAIGSGLSKLKAGIGGGLGQLSESLYPVDPSMVGAMDPQQIAALRKAAMIRTGLGMMAGGEQGSGLGGSILTGPAAGGDPFEKIITTSYTNAQKKRAEDKADARYSEERTYKTEQDRLQAERDDRIQKRLEQAAKDEKAYREQMVKLQGQANGIRAVGAEEDRAKAERMRAQDKAVQAIMDKADAEKRDLTRSEMLKIQAIRGNSLSTAMDPLQALLGGLGMGSAGLQLPGAGGAGGTTPQAVMDAWRAPLKK